MVSPVLVGREAEIGMLGEAFEAAAGGTPQVVLVGGEAGSGKSRVVAEFTAGLRERALLLVGGCVDLGGAGLPYAPFTAALRDLVREQGPAEVTGLLPGHDAGELAGLLPELGSPPAGGDPEMARGRLFGLLLTLVERLAGTHPLVLVIEDLHWADRSTGELLAFLAGNLRQAAVLLVVTFRPDDLARAGPLRRLLAGLGRLEGVTRLELARLSRRQVAAQLEAILGRPAEPAVTAAVFERGGGNPLFTEVLLNADGTVSPGLPGPVRDLLLSTVSELPWECQRVLRGAAVGGARIRHGLLATVTGHDGTALDDLLRPAVSAGVVIADEAAYAFRHELFREVLLGDLLPGERADAHRAFAAALEADPALTPAHLPPLQVALHWRGAGEHERALRAAWAAAAAAGAAFAYSEQLEMLELVLELWPRVPGAGHGDIDPAVVAEEAADAARLAGEPERGLPLVQAAVGRLDDPRDVERVASLLRLRAALRQQLLLPGQLDDLRAALRLAAGPTRVRAQILAQLIRALRLRDRDEEAESLVRELRELAAEVGGEIYRIEAQITAALLRRHGDGAVIPEMTEAVEAARRAGSGRLEVLARLAITDTLEGLGEHETAVRAGREDLARTRQLGLARYVTAPVAGNLAESLTSAGRWDEALAVIDEGLSLDLAPFGRASLLLHRGWIAVARGEQGTAARMVAELRSFPAADAETQRALPLSQLKIQIRLAEGDLAGALAVAGAVPGVRAASDPRYLWPLLAAAMQACAEASLIGSPEIAGDSVGLQDALARRAASTPRPGRVEQAHAAVFTAEASRAGGGPDLAAWDTAAAAWSAIGQPYLLAYALLRAAAAAAAQGDRDGAAARLPRAAELAGQLGARPLQQQIGRLARRARIDLPADATGQAGPAVPFGLTAREMEVLRLVAAGRGNQQVAAELFISPKTASVHVSNILAKLGVASRVEAAAAAHRLHLFG